MASGHDRVVSGRGRVALGHDRVASGHDRVAPGHDRVASGHDRVASGRDRVTSGHDQVASGRDRVVSGNGLVGLCRDRMEFYLIFGVTGADLLFASMVIIQTLKTWLSKYPPDSRYPWQYYGEAYEYFRQAGEKKRLETKPSFK